MNKHTCQESRTCHCSSQALEPNEDCPVHGYPWPPRCAQCGHFMPWLKTERVLDYTQSFIDNPPSEENPYKLEF